MAYPHAITIEQKSITRDTYGGEVVAWSTFCTTWSRILPLNGRELFAAQAVQSEITGKILMQYIAGLSTGMRITHEGKHYDIHAVIDAALQHREIQLLVSEGLTK
jgi:SPP1 family predicted phage head-tail adaptor